MTFKKVINIIRILHYVIATISYFFPELFNAYTRAKDRIVGNSNQHSALEDKARIDVVKVKNNTLHNQMI
ncbi:hypothetical protein BpHYR1_008006 [Brachionus plicatilis]|uniref:Uncharacterized protein n=1 Tax=Brachionus plicatilis TaxID=10195 RepID=A0A3M7R381_BRAPC|nr:hypothetical protein BpHYR1_008006 [Brachionus plicatilis]